MSESNLGNLTEAAKTLSHNPLGIIALFVVFIYGFATLVFGLSGQNLAKTSKVPLIWFLVLFPVLVLGVFTWLVAKHHQKLYAPGDFVKQEDFLKLQAFIIERGKTVDLLTGILPVPVAINPIAEKPKRQRTNPKEKVTVTK